MAAMEQTTPPPVTEILVPPSNQASLDHIKTPTAKAGRKKLSGSEKTPPKQESGDAASIDTRRSSATLTAFTAQCARCLKWRIVPDLETYEAIRARVGQRPFHCEQTAEWQKETTCETPTDLEQDGKLLWAMDKQDIPQPPAGWRRKIVIRGGTSQKFSDIYYYSPCGKTLRSVNDVERFLAEHKQYSSVSIKQFSFAAPRRLASPKKGTSSASKVSASKRKVAELDSVAKQPAEASAAPEVGGDKEDEQEVKRHNGAESSEQDPANILD